MKAFNRKANHIIVVALKYVLTSGRLLYYIIVLTVLS